MTQHISYPTTGTCSRQIDIELEDGIIRNVTFTGGCHGNTQGIAALVRGMKASDAAARGSRESTAAAKAPRVPTSWPGL